MYEHKIEIFPLNFYYFSCFVFTRRYICWSFRSCFNLYNQCKVHQCILNYIFFGQSPILIIFILCSLVWGKSNWTLQSEFHVPFLLIRNIFFKSSDVWYCWNKIWITLNKIGKQYLRCLRFDFLLKKKSNPGSKLCSDILRDMELKDACMGFYVFCFSGVKFFLVAFLILVLNIFPHFSTFKIIIV